MSEMGDAAERDSEPTVATQLTISESQGPAIALSESRNRHAGPISSDKLWAELRLVSQTFYDVQEMNKAMQNRIRHTENGVAVVALEQSVKTLEQMENALSKDMQRVAKQVAPAVYEWVENTSGLGHHIIARLLGAIGDPVLAHPYHWEGEGEKRHLVADKPFERNVAKLWAYCGHGDPARKRKRGMAASDAIGLGNPLAKSLTFLAAECCMKQRTSPYRAVYDAAKVKYADRAEWSDGHKHAAALRVTGKTILRDLWIVHKKWLDSQNHASVENHRGCDTQNPLVLPDAPFQKTPDSQSISVTHDRIAAGVEISKPTRGRHRANCGTLFTCPTGKHGVVMP